MLASRLTEKMLAEFKFNETDENQTIARLVRRVLPENRNLILDIGAGLGDIASEAFPERPAVLVDIADFERAPCKAHSRVTQDFFDYQYCGVEPVTMLLSHVLQYLDDDLPMLRHKVAEIDPEYIIVVCDITDDFQESVFNWFSKNQIPFNAEVPLHNFPPANYQLEERIEFDGEIKTDSFATLADRLGKIIFDASINTMQSRKFGNWLSHQLSQPKVLIPQSIELFRRRTENEK